jgi:hypothetical protein
MASTWGQLGASPMQSPEGIRGTDSAMTRPLTPEHPGRLSGATGWALRPQLDAIGPKRRISVGYPSTNATACSE